MKYCLKWTNLSTSLKEVDEISIKYIEDKGLIDFMEKYAGKRIILRIVAAGFSDSEIAKLAAIRRQFPDYAFTVALDEVNVAIIAKLAAKEIPFYIAQPVQDWETFHYYLRDLGVSDIDLSGALAFEFPKVKRVLERLDTKVVIRITPNFARAITPHCKPLQTFFIRPDDIDLYEEYIDVLEFAGIEHQDTFYKIYAKEKTFIGRLDQCIYNLSAPIDNVGLISEFGERRISCGRQCIKGGWCNRCNTLASIAEKMSAPIREKVKENIQLQIKNMTSSEN